MNEGAEKLREIDERQREKENESEDRETEWVNEREIIFNVLLSLLQ